MITNWNEEELLAYILIYCSLADLTISPEEQAYLTSRFTKDFYLKMLAEVEGDTEEVRKPKIKDAYDEHIFRNDETDLIYEEIHNIFTLDGDFDELERNLWRQLDQILNPVPAALAV